MVNSDVVVPAVVVVSVVVVGSAVVMHGVVVGSKTRENYIAEFRLSLTLASSRLKCQLEFENLRLDCRI